MKRSNARTVMTQKNSSSSAGLGQVRIIGGEFRGRKLPVLTAEGLRPTSDRVRETLFNWLQFEVPRARCLDVFAGSGALGFEALSRGAEQVVFLELASNNCQQLRTNVQNLHTQRAQVIQANSLDWLQQTQPNAFDIIFVDPPFHQNLMQPTLDLIFAKNWLKNDQAWLYLEQENTLDWPIMPEGWVCHREKKTAQVQFGLFKYQSQ